MWLFESRYYNCTRSCCWGSNWGLSDPKAGVLTTQPSCSSQGTTLSFQIKNPRGAVLLSQEVEAMSRSFTLNGLTPRSRYDLELVAKDDHGASITMTTGSLTTGAENSQPDQGGWTFIHLFWLFFFKTPPQNLYMGLWFHWPKFSMGPWEKQWVDKKKERESEATE